MLYLALFVMLVSMPYALAGFFKGLATIRAAVVAAKAEQEAHEAAIEAYKNARRAYEEQG